MIEEGVVRYNFNDLVDKDFAVVSVFDCVGLLFDLRLNKDTVPDGLYAFDIRHADEDWGVPVEIKEHVLVNYFGTVITDVDLLQGLEYKEFTVIEEEYEDEFLHETVDVMYALEFGYLDDSGLLSRLLKKWQTH